MQKSMALGEMVYRKQQEEAAAEGAESPEGSNDAPQGDAPDLELDDDDIIDAEVVDEDGDDKKSA